MSEEEKKVEKTPGDGKAVGEMNESGSTPEEKQGNPVEVKLENENPVEIRQESNEPEKYTEPKEKKKRLLDYAQRSLGTAKLEERTNRALLKGVLGRFLQWIAMSPFPFPPGFRVWLQRRRGVSIGKHVFMGVECFIDPPFPHMVTIEDYVSLAGRVMILAHSDPTEPLRELLGPEGAKIAPVHLKRGAWISVGSIILPGVTIGENTIVAAGAVVSKSMPDHCVVGGVPARVIKKIERKTEKNKVVNKSEENEIDMKLEENKFETDKSKD